MKKELIVINAEDASEVASVLESKVFTAGMKCPNKGVINLLDALYYIMDPTHEDKLFQPCALGTCASPEWTCYTCPFANRRPFSENLRIRAKVHYRKEMGLLLLYRRYKKIWG